MSNQHDLEDDLALARSLAREAAEISLDCLRRGAQAKTKADGTVVTDADHAVERHLVDEIARHRPDDAILGEESGRRGRSNRRWILDPIDGTSNFASGRPQWGNHVALEIDGEIAIGLITRPVDGKSWWASRNGGAYASGDDGVVETLRVSDVARLADSRVAVWTEGESAAVLKVREHAQHVPSDLNAILDLAAGRLEAVIDPTGKPWDHAPAIVLVEEAGGRFSDAHGGHRCDRGEGRFSNGSIHAELVAALDG